MAAVYFSRVVHPNYLIPAAVLLPVGVLARRLRADLAARAAPALRSGGGDRRAPGLPHHLGPGRGRGPARRLGGLAAALAPRAGPHLTQDPLGLLFSATAGGLAILYLTLGMARAGPSRRAPSPSGVAGRARRGGAAPGHGAGRRPNRPRPGPGPGRGPVGRGREAAGLGPQPIHPAPRGHPSRPRGLRHQLPPRAPGRDPPRPAEHAAGLVDPGHPGPARRPPRHPALGPRSPWPLLAALVARSGEAEQRTTAVGLTVLLAPLALGTVLGSTMALLARGPGRGVADLPARPTMGGRPAGRVGRGPGPPRPAPGAACSSCPWSTATGRGGQLWPEAGSPTPLAVLPVALLDLPSFAARACSRFRPGPRSRRLQPLRVLGVEGATAARGSSPPRARSARPRSRGVSLRRREPPSPSPAWLLSPGSPSPRPSPRMPSPCPSSSWAWRPSPDHSEPAGRSAPGIRRARSSAGPVAGSDSDREAGAGGGTRTRTDRSTRPSSVRVCQFHHSGTGGGERLSPQCYGRPGSLSTPATGVPGVPAPERQRLVLGHVLLQKPIRKRRPSAVPASVGSRRDRPATVPHDVDKDDVASELRGLALRALASVLPACREVVDARGRSRGRGVRPTSSRWRSPPASVPSSAGRASTPRARGSPAPPSCPPGSSTSLSSGRPGRATGGSWTTSASATGRRIDWTCGRPLLPLGSPETTGDACACTASRRAATSG